MTRPVNRQLPRLPARLAESHKGDYGRGLLVGGSQGMAGAMALAGQAALRAGVGLLKLAVPDVCQATVAGFEPSYMTVGLASDAEGRIAAAAREMVIEQARQATAIGIGPGLGQSDALDELVVWMYRILPTPMVVDADALNALARHPDVLGKAGGPRILTPHPGEFVRLTGLPAESLETRRAQAFELAARCKVVVVLKGHQTLVSDGKKTVTNPTGNPGMATGGAGDVLTGLLTALVCQGMSPWEAGQLGVYVHGLAGDLAAEQLGQVSLIASDLIGYLPAAFQALEVAAN